MIETISFNIMPFEVRHDVRNVGFVVHETLTEENLLFATDFFALRQSWAIPFDIIAIALNYDVDILDKMVAEEAIPEALAKRLLQNHPSQQWVIDYLQNHLDLSECRELHLLHGSDTRLAKDRAKQEIKDKLYMEAK